MFQKFLLTPEKTFRGKATNVALGFLICLIWVMIVKFLLNNLAGFPILQVEDDIPARLMFFLAVIAAPLWEEAAYRWFPMKVVQWFGNHTLIPIMVISSLIFGWGHGFGTVSLLIQGVCGFVMCCVYVKNGFSYWSSVALHALWNFMVGFGLYYLIN